MKTDLKNVSNPRMHNPDGMYASEARNEDYFSLLDYFAGQALNGICACSLDNYGAISNNAEPDYIANKCYDIATAMLKRRSIETLT